MKLFISTATDKIYLMTFEKNKVVKQMIHQGNNDHTTSFYSLVEQLEVDLKTLEAIYVVNGPGSYTGLRVGVLFAKVVAMEFGMDVYPLNLLEVLHATNNDQKIAVDAKGKKYYIYDGSDHNIVGADMIDDTFLIDPLINLDDLCTSELLENANCVDYNSLGVNYVKNAI